MDIIRQLGALAFASRLKRISDKLLKDGSRIYREQKIDFEARWFPVLYLLSKKSPLAITEVARELRLTHPAVNQFAGDMSKAGLLVSSRDKNDDRRRLLSLSAAGRDLVDELTPIWRDIEEATREVLNLSGTNLLGALDIIEEALDETDMYRRVMARIKKRQSEAVEIIEYRPQYKKYFKSLNIEWLEEYFTVEAEDEKILSDPNGRIIKTGGAVLFARFDGKVVGTTALIRRDETTFEIAKMAVTEKVRGRQIGRRLLTAAIDKAISLGAQTVVLLTSPKLKTAHRLYRRFGFTESAMPEWATGYGRCSVFMTLNIEQSGYNLKEKSLS